MAAPLGNQNAAKSRLIEQALIREIKQRDLKDGDGETLRKIAAAQVDRALSGDPISFDRVADRLDGRPAQQLIHAADPENPLTLSILNPEAKL